ncbi:MAG: bifunctional DNA-formamidopyrimidine glycosylase/DNA-(apurinic or apyrimidinic site) lyase [Alphaproteobacteria bacterium]
MPELPEVETVRRGLATRIAGQVIRRVEARRPDLRVPLPENFSGRLAGRRIQAIDRRAKYLLLRLDDGEILVVHLGMSGRLVLAHGAPGRMIGPHEHVVIHLDDDLELRFDDHRRFGLMTLIRDDELRTHDLFAKLGPEPLDIEFDGLALARSLSGRRTPIKAALLDQSIVAGLGNIYVCESLFRARLSPRRLAASVQGERAERLVKAVRDVLSAAIEAGGSSLRDYVQASGELGYFQHKWLVYGREGQRCRTRGCGRTIRRIVQSNRSTFYCGRCQR